MAKPNLNKTIFRWFLLQTMLLALSVVATIQLIYQNHKMVEIHQLSMQLEEKTLDLMMLANEQIIRPSERVKTQWATAVNQFKDQLLYAESLGQRYQYPQLFAQLADIETLINLIQREAFTQVKRNQLQPSLVSQIYNLLSYSRQVRKSSRQDYDENRIYILAMIVILGLLVIISPLIIKVRMRSIFIDPIQTLIDATRILSKKDFSQPIPEAELAELDQLATTMNEMRITLLTEMALKSDLLTEIEQRRLAEQEATKLLNLLKASQQQMIQMEKLSAIGVMVGGVAHELNNPLMGIHNYIEYSLNKIDNPKTASILQKAMVELERIQHLVKNMLIFSRSKKSTALENISLKDTVNSVVELMRPDFKKYAIQIEIEIPDETHVYSSSDLIKQILVNLLSNARDALKQKENAQIKITANHHAANKITLSVSDNGDGIPQETQLKVFDPFFTTKPTGEGTGLGLNISQELAQQLDSELILEDTSSEGTTFSLELPLVKTQTEV